MFVKAESSNGLHLSLNICLIFGYFLLRCVKIDETPATRTHFLFFYVLNDLSCVVL